MAILRFFLYTGLFFVALALPQSKRDAKEAQQRLRQEEVDDYYEKWLKQDVVYLITDEERAVFENLSTSEEKEQFIEQFWRRRDPDPASPVNEFREEHYRRIAYANDHFSIGAPGWKTDRGRIYILHGSPDSIEDHAQGEQHYRTAHEGGGNTTTYAWQVWWYRHIPGVGDDVEIEFVDKTMTGHYTFARDEMDKDAMLWVPGMGLTLSDRFDAGQKAERIGTRSMANVASRRAANPLKIFSRKDDLFERLRRYSKLQEAPEIKYKDLEAIVDFQVYHNQLPFTVRTDLIRITQEDFLVPITFFFDTHELNSQGAGPRGQVTLNIYGRIESLTRRKIFSFDDEVILDRSPHAPAQSKRAVYQRMVPLKPGRYKLVAIVKDSASGRIGSLEKGIHIRAESQQELELSPIILADSIRPAQREEFIDDPFVLSALKVYPNSSNEFKRGTPLGFYFEVYNAVADQQTLEPSLSLDLKITKDGREVPTPFQNLDRYLHRFSDRFFAGATLNTQALQPGTYRLEISVTDRITQSTASQSATFQVL